MSEPIKVTRERGGSVARVTLARPDIANAFDDRMIAELLSAGQNLQDDAGVRVVVLQSEGKHFSAGADLNWMKKAADYDRKQNIDDAKVLAEMLDLWDLMPKPVVGRVPGAAIGGGVGLVAVCDVVVASTRAVVGLSEVRLGLVPAVISPYVAAKMGASRARALFMTAERLDATAAREAGLIHEVVEPEALDAAVDAKVEALLQGGPHALAEAKKLVRTALETPRERVGEVTAALIADLRDSDEGREGIRSFLEKRKPRWSE